MYQDFFLPSSPINHLTTSHSYLVTLWRGPDPEVRNPPDWTAPKLYLKKLYSSTSTRYNCKIPLIYIYIYMYRCNGVMNLILRFFPGDVLREERKQVGVSLCDMWELRLTSGADEVVTGAEQSSHIKHDNTSVTGTVFLQNHNFYIWCFKCILFLIINHRILLNWARLSTTPEPPTSCHPHPPTDHLNPPFFTTSPPRSLWSGQLQT